MISYKDKLGNWGLIESALSRQSCRISRNCTEFEVSMQASLMEGGAKKYQKSVYVECESPLVNKPYVIKVQRNYVLKNILVIR